jgi:ABC-type multidrug transport system fused ATPase/permease subunit
MKYVIPKSNAFFTQLNILHGVIVDMITNMRISRIFARTGLEATYLKTQSKHTSDARGQFYKGWVAMQIVTNFCFVVLAVTLSATAYYKFTKNIYDAGQLIFIISAIPTMIMACNFASYYASMAAEKIGTIREGISLIHTPQTDYQKTTDHTAHTTPTILHHKTAPKIDFQHIDFSYNQNAPLFTHFDFSISAGEKIGLVGRSGAGKSTLIDLLLRFKSPQNGEILIDNQPLSQFSQQEWQDYISIVPQNSMLFNRSILENIAYSRPEAKMDEIIIAAKQAHIHEFIQSLPQQYDSMVGENGVKLSGGQKQRIAIARALLKQAPILILDEATSALDTESEQHIQDSMRHLMDDKTVIVIAHRLSTLSRLDRLVILEQGKIIETGTHAALLANPQSHYKKLWDQQSDSFL